MCVSVFNLLMGIFLLTERCKVLRFKNLFMGYYGRVLKHVIKVIYGSLSILFTAL